MKCILLFFPHLPQFDWILLLMNLHFCSSLSTWMIFHGISYLSCPLMNKYSLITWCKFLHSLLSLSLSLSLVWLKFFLAWWPSLFFHTVWCFLKILSLLNGFPFYLALMNSLFWTWWIFLFRTCHIVFIKELTKWFWIHKVSTSSSWDLSMHT